MTRIVDRVAHPKESPLSKKKPAAKRAIHAMKKPPAKTVAERQAALRERRAELGHAELRGVYAHVEDHPEIKQEAARIVRRRVRNAKKETP